jgi:hypothetical protein
MMDEIIGLWKRLRPRAKAGGRVQMDTIESRATIFAIRANIDFGSMYFTQTLRTRFP